MERINNFFKGLQLVMSLLVTAGVLSLCIVNLVRGCITSVMGVVFCVAMLALTASMSIISWKEYQGEKNK